jgi:hypothetical protein
MAAGVRGNANIMKAITRARAIVAKGSGMRDTARILVLVDIVVMDDFLYKEPAAVVPEPTTLLLFGTTMAGLGLVRWRRHRQN